MRFALRWLVSLSLCLMAQAAAAGSLVDLFLQTPEPPADGVAAAAWVRQGQIVAPALLGFEKQLKQQQVDLARAPTVAATAVTNASAVLAAVRGYEAYRTQNSDAQDPMRMLAKRSAWLIKRFDDVRPNANDQRVTDHDMVDDELKAWGALFRDWRFRRRNWIERGERELAAAGDPNAIASAENAAAVKAYRAAMLREIDIQLSITRLAVERFMTPR